MKSKLTIEPINIISKINKRIPPSRYKTLSMSYVSKRLIHGWPLFIALLLSIILAATFFAGINISADTSARQALNQQLSSVNEDVYIRENSNYGGTGQTLFSSQNLTEAMKAVLEVEDVTSAVIISSMYTHAEINNFSQSFQIVGFYGDSIGDWLVDVSAIGPNEAYLWSGSIGAQSLKDGDVISFNDNITYSINNYEQAASNILFNSNLTITNHIELTDRALGLATGSYYIGSSQYQNYYYNNLLIVSWDKTLAPLLDLIYNSSAQYSNLDARIVVNLDKEKLISPWDTSGSITSIHAVTLKINEAVSQYNLEASNNLESFLTYYQSTAMSMRFVFIISALPVFFVAWYTGSTVSNVSFNLRRREIALLSTKGFSNRQLLSMFLLEAILIGTVGGVVAIAISYALNPWFITIAGGQSLGAPALTLDSIALTIVFAIIVALLSFYKPAKNAVNMTTVDALKDYVQVEKPKRAMKLLAWIALILGSFKMALFLSGINLITIVNSVGMSSGNAIVYFLLALFSMVDYVLIFIGPFLFFWGFTKIFVQESKKFPQLIEKITKLAGDLGKLAGKSVRRNPGRVAAVAFLTAFVIGYSFIIVGATASIQDVTTRQSYFNVGADVSVTLSSANNVSLVTDTIRNNISQIETMTVEYGFDGSSGLGSYGQTIKLEAVDPNVWLSTAYVEEDLFTGNSAQKAFQELASNNHSIILDINLANSLSKKIGENITVNLNSTQKEQLIIVGFFGVASSQSSSYMYYWLSQYWSYIPQGLCQELGMDESSFVPRILLNLQNGADSKSVADQINNLKINDATVDSVVDKLLENQSNASIVGLLNTMQLGAIFFVLAASVGTALVMLVSIRERKREASIMSVRGLSYKQLLIMFLTENLAVITLALVLGTVIGLIAMRGTISAFSAYNVFGSMALNMHIVFPLNSFMIILVSYVLIYAATILPIVIMTRKYSSNLDRTVREA